MKNLKFLVLFGVLATAVSACSDTTYTPNAFTNSGLNSGYNNNYRPTNTNGAYTANGTNPCGSSAFSMQPSGVPCNGSGMMVNPYINSGCTTCGGGARVGVQANWMWSWQARLNAGFYYNYSYNNCLLRRTVTWTPVSCACIKAPCDCNLVVQQASNSQQFHPIAYQGPGYPGSSTPGANPSGSTPPADPNASAADPNAPAASGTVEKGPGVNPPGLDPSGIDPSEKPLSITIANDDAEELFKRLAKEKDATFTGKGTHLVGKLYDCTEQSGGALSKKQYMCDLDIHVTDGKIYEKHPVGEKGQARAKDSKPYESKDLKIGGQGTAANEAVITIRGKIASYLYDKMTAAAVDATLPGDANTAVRMKTGTDLKCYETSKTLNPERECQIRLQADTGEGISPAS